MNIEKEFELVSEIDSLKLQVDILKDNIRVLTNGITRLTDCYNDLNEHCNKMFVLIRENQESTNARISQMSDRLHHHIMNL